MKIKLSSIILIITYLMIINIPYLSQRINNLITLFIEIFISVCLLSTREFKGQLKKNNGIFLFAIIMMICTFINFQISTRFINAVVTGIEYLLLFLVVDTYCKKYGCQYVINSIWSIILFVIILVDVVAIVTSGRGIGNDGGVLSYFIIGNKFTVSYHQMFFLSMYLAQNIYIKKEKLRRSLFFILLLHSIAICYLIDCNTGIVGCLVIGIIYILSYKKDSICEFLSSPIVFITIFLGSSFLLIGTDFLINNHMFQNIISNVFHRNMTLTGRMRMFEISVVAISENLWWGYGINSTYVQDVLSWGNAQNGFLKMLLDYGVMGVISFIFVCLSAFNKKKCFWPLKTISFPIMSFLYGMAICTMVEINIGGVLFLGLALYKSAGNYVYKITGRTGGTE